MTQGGRVFGSVRMKTLLLRPPALWWCSVRQETCADNCSTIGTRVRYTVLITTSERRRSKICWHFDSRMACSRHCGTVTTSTTSSSASVSRSMSRDAADTTTPPVHCGTWCRTTVQIFWLNGKSGASPAKPYLESVPWSVPGNFRSFITTAISRRLKQSQERAPLQAVGWMALLLGDNCLISRELSLR